MTLGRKAGAICPAEIGSLQHSLNYIVRFHQTEKLHFALELFSHLLNLPIASLT